ncbi:MAG: pyridoxamine 5'-phosphate oxidase family protein [Pseudomonadota bacterium]|nr:pyridoxamine 5'-phosphate oxidase family protein [Pseudomonadota bacterium]|tara:strand:+ start:4615 stop:5196 length:582 start_codon:yes stop_codon:yes gene_type:complete
MSIKNPKHYNDISQIYEIIWEKLIDGMNNRNSGFHTFTLATICNGSVSARTVVLRECDKNNLTISFHTNNLSKKIKEIKNNSNVECLFYSEAEKIQIRISGDAKIYNSDKVCQEIWMRMSQDSRDCYLYNKEPGTLIKDPEDISLKETTEISKNFSFVNVTINKIEWLYLSSSGHRRVLFNKENSFKGNWVVP